MGRTFMTECDYKSETEGVFEIVDIFIDEIW